MEYNEKYEDKLEKPNGGIVLENFSEGDGFYKVNLAYLSKEQVEEIENIVKKWNPELESEDERIKACIGMCLTDVCEQRFKDYNTSLKDCLSWLEKQGEHHIACSEEQMKVLDEVLTFAANHENPYWNTYILGTLNSLIKQLKNPKV